MIVWIQIWTESRRSRDEVQIENVPNEPTGELGTGGAGPPWREGLFLHRPVLPRTSA